MRRRLMVASAIAAALTAAFLPGSGIGSAAPPVRGAQRIPAGLAAAIHARFGASRAQWPAAPGLGLAVSLSADGTTALVGAPGFLLYPGAAAYIFHVSDAGSWSSSETPTAVLRAASGMDTGLSVALSADGTTAFLGSPATGSGQHPSGAVYVFHVSGEDAWVSSSTPAATLTAKNHDLLGDSLAVSSDGTTLVAGEPDDNSVGGAFIFHVSSEAAWASTSTPTATLSNADGNPPNFVGASVAMSADGTTALVSDSYNPSGGGAWVYHVPAEDAWTSSSTPTAILGDANSIPGDYFGSLALSGDGTVALIGAPNVNTDTGTVDIYRASAEDSWASTSTPAATLTAAGGRPYDSFGLQAALSTSGTTALIGTAAGGAYVFGVSSEGAWASTASPSATLVNSRGHFADFLGTATALSADGATALVGAPGAHLQAGAADVFHVADASSWASSGTPTAILTDSNLFPCLVPKLIGRTVSAAKAALKANSCRLGKVRRVHAAKGKKGRVVSQSRPARRLLSHGAKVDVRIGK